MWKKLDAFAKPREDLRQTSALGGLVTILAALAAGLLFLGQVYVYLTGVTRHSLHLSESSWHPVPVLNAKKSTESHMPLSLHISFPHIPCHKLDLSHDGVSYKDPKFRTIHGWNKKSVMARPLTSDEYQTSTGERATSSQNILHGGCTFQGTYNIPKVGGTFSLGLSPAAWGEVSTFLMMGMRGMGSPKSASKNTTHYIHSITFGEPFPLMKNPLQDDLHVVVNDMGGIALANVMVKLIPTRYSSLFSSGRKDQYQVSVTEHIVQPETLAQQGSRFLPGLAVTYDMTPLAVHHVEQRDSILVFLSSLVSIVGGAFVTVKLITGCLVAGAQEIAKKMD